MLLYYNSKSAAEKLNEIYDDPLTWWQQPEIQTAKDVFCQEFALTSDNSLEEWKVELQSLTK